VDSHPDRIQFISADEDGKAYSLRDVESTANQIAHWLKEDMQCQQHDAIAIMFKQAPLRRTLDRGCKGWCDCRPSEYECDGQNVLARGRRGYQGIKQPIGNC